MRKVYKGERTRDGEDGNETQGEKIDGMNQRLMTAAVLYGKEDLRLEQVEVPEPRAGELIVRVGAALTCGTDLKVYRRGYHAKMIQPPMPFGHEVAGTVSAVGEGVTEFAVGDRIAPMNSAPCGVCYFCRKGQENLCDDLLFNNGAYAEFLRVPARIVAKNTLPIDSGWTRPGVRGADGAAGVRDARARRERGAGGRHDDCDWGRADRVDVYACGGAGGRRRERRW